MLQVYQELTPIIAGDSQFTPTNNRHLVVISNPRIEKGILFLQLCIQDWNKDQCFYYPHESIDNKEVYIHTLWKFSSDSNYVLTATADLDIEKTDYNDLNIRDWKSK